MATKGLGNGLKEQEEQPSHTDATICIRMRNSRTTEAVLGIAVPFPESSTHSD